MKNIFWIFFLLSLITKSQILVVGDTTSPNIIYNNIKDTILPNNLNYDLDFEGDNIKDVRLGADKISHLGFYDLYIYIYSLSNVEVVLIPSNAYVDTIAKNLTLNSSLNWQNVSLGKNLREDHVYFFPTPSGTSAGPFIRSNNYLAFRKINPSDTIYGWILLDMTSSPYKSMTVKSYCYKASTVGIKNNVLSKSAIHIGPNPVTDLINLLKGNLSFEDIEIEIINSLGQTVLKTEFKNQIDVSELANGFYTLLLKDNSGSIITKKFVKE